MTTELTATAVINRARIEFLTTRTIARQTSAISTAARETAFGVCTNLSAVVLLPGTLVDIDARFEIISKIEARWTFTDKPANRQAKTESAIMYERCDGQGTTTRERTFSSPNHSPSFDVLTLV